MPSKDKNKSSEMLPKKQKIQDELGRVHVLEKKIAEGGQGAVVTIQGQPRWLVKLSKWPSADPRTKAWAQQIEAVKRLPIEDFDLPFAMPKAMVLKPRLGYLMELMDGLVPLENLLIQAQESMLEGRGLKGFLDSGGLKRRLALLSRLARVLARLHGLGIAHGDISPKNIFVSESVDHAEVWMIDCDNLTYAVKDSTLQLYTPDYGAPELVREDAGISTYTDIWSFAVLAFQLLTFLHPYKSGALVDEDADLEHAALRGELPWVDDPSDSRNRSICGLDRTSVCTEALARLFDRCFRLGGLAPEARPLMSEWAEVLEAACALQVKCAEDIGGCGSTHIWTVDGACPFCGHSTHGDRTVRLHHFIFCRMDQLPEGSEKKDRWIKTDYCLMAGPDPIQLRSSPPGSATYADSAVIAEFVTNSGELHITPKGDRPLHLQVAGDKSATQIKGRVKLPRRQIAHALHLGNLADMHDAWNFKW